MALGAVEVAVACGAAYAAWRVYVYYTSLQIYGPPDMTPAFAPLSLGGTIFGLGQEWVWDRRTTAYKHGKEVIRLTPWLWGESVLYTRSVDIMRQVGGGGTNTTWTKPDWASIALLLCGRNLISESLDQWKRHRRIMQPAFNTKTYEFVWKETARIYQDLVQEDGWPMQSGATMAVNSLNRITHKVGLYVISACGFGLTFPWSAPPMSEDRTSIQHNIETIERHYLSLTFAPKWIWKLPIASLRRIHAEYKSLLNFMLQEVAQRRATIEEALKHGESDDSYVKQDVFSRLVLANLTDGKNNLSDSELIGNTFALLVAGHDTTAATLAAAAALLAVYPDEQEAVRQEITKAIDQNGELSFAHYSKLPRTLAVFTEASRLYPAGHIGIRQSLEDTVLKTPSPDSGLSSDTVMPKGSIVITDFVGMQYNPHRFKDPMTFNPSRWEGVNEEAIVSFSIGPRTCIGKKFAMVEAVCFMSHLLRDFKIEPLLEPGETLDQWKARILGNVKFVLTLSISDVPIVLTRR